MARSRAYVTPYIRMTRDLRTWDRQVRADPEVQRLVDEEREAQATFERASLSGFPGKSLGIAQSDLTQARARLQAALADRIPRWKREKREDFKAWREELASTGRQAPALSKPKRTRASLPTMGDAATMAKISSTAATYRPTLEDARQERYEQRSMLNSYLAVPNRDPKRESVIRSKVEASEAKVAELERAERLAPISGSFTTDSDAEMALMNSIDLDLPKRRRKAAPMQKAKKASKKRGTKKAKRGSGMSCKAAGKALAKCSASARKKSAKASGFAVRKKPSGGFAV